MYDPLAAVGDASRLDRDVERLSHLVDKVAQRPRWDIRGGSLTLKIDAVVTGTREILELEVRFQSRRGSRVEALLKRRGGTILRQWHVHEGHMNPDGLFVEPTHKHFSTVDLPIGNRNHKGQPTWAYSTYDINPEDVGDVITGFAAECRIFGIQLPTDLR